MVKDDNRKLRTYFWISKNINGVIIISVKKPEFNKDLRWPDRFFEEPHIRFSSALYNSIERGRVYRCFISDHYIPYKKRLISFDQDGVNVNLDRKAHFFNIKIDTLYYVYEG